MAKFAKRFVQAGARFFGGCCGTTPAHIKLISDSVHSISPRRQKTADRHEVIRLSEIKPSDVSVIDPVDRSRWSRKIALGEFV
ncbi:homocysteine S-methyltransferase family protein, partial [Escherichia coli]|nr:homocysteine S-methyltransferase family protein [Escherichia coli]